jgi:hypothetical protein
MKTGLPRRVRKAINRLNTMRNKLVKGELSFSEVETEYRELERIVKGK